MIRIPGRRFLKTLFILFYLVPLTTAGQEFSFPELTGFKKITKFPVFKPDNLRDYLGGAAETYIDLGFVELTLAEYKRGKENIRLGIYEHSSHEMAFGIYASERSSADRFLNLGAQGYLSGTAIRFFKGRYYVKMIASSEKPKILKSAESLAGIVAEMMTGEVTMPSLLSEFPAEGRKQNEDTFISVNVLGHQFLKEAYKSNYEIGNDNFSIYMINFSSPQEAYKTAGAFLSSAKIESVQSDEGRYIFTDGYNGILFLSWKDKRMIIITGLAKDQSEIADKYTSDMLDQ